MCDVATPWIALHPYAAGHCLHRLPLIALCLCAFLATGCAPRTEGPVLLQGRTYPSHSRVITVRQAPHEEARAIALISLRTQSPPEDLARFIGDAQVYGRRLGADDCAIEVIPDPLGGFVLHGYLQVGRWRAVTDIVQGQPYDKLIQQVLESMRD